MTAIVFNGLRRAAVGCLYDLLGWQLLHHTHAMLFTQMAGCLCNLWAMVGGLWLSDWSSGCNEGICDTVLLTWKVFSYSSITVHE